MSARFRSRRALADRAEPPRLEHRLARELQGRRRHGDRGGAIPPDRTEGLRTGETRRVGNDDRELRAGRGKGRIPELESGNRSHRRHDLGHLRAADAHQRPAGRQDDLETQRRGRGLVGIIERRDQRDAAARGTDHRGGTREGRSDRARRIDHQGRGGAGGAAFGVGDADGIRTRVIERDGRQEKRGPRRPRQRGGALEPLVGQRRRAGGLDLEDGRRADGGPLGCRRHADRRHGGQAAGGHAQDNNGQQAEHEAGKLHGARKRLAREKTHGAGTAGPPA